jgi:hypothetical protein
MRSSSIVMTLPNGLGVVSVMATLLSLTWLRFATSSSARFKGRQPYLFVRKIPYVISDSARSLRNCSVIVLAGAPRRCLKIRCYSGLVCTPFDRTGSLVAQSTKAKEFSCGEEFQA